MKKGLLGLGEKKQINWLEIFAAVDNDEVKNCFQLYFSNELDKLQSKLHTMEKLDEMKAKI
ncbi:hypothetical protein [Aquimarina sp. LLG6339-5]|uniref:hypothetical protein n=1 Tax=Aquimarina sp. LLG6339-5 TaxID=3160830 RepID=UPI00386CA4DC